MAILGVDDFKSKLRGGGARPNLFKATINFPAYAGGDVELTSFMCKAAQLPQSMTNSFPVAFRGRELKVAGDRTFDDWTVSIINDTDFAVRDAFERWMNGMNTHATNVRNPAAASPAGYTTDATVTQYGKNGNTLKQYKFIGVFPTDLSPIDVDWGSNDTIEEFTVTLSYQWWESPQDNVA